MTKFSNPRARGQEPRQGRSLCRAGRGPGGNSDPYERGFAAEIYGEDLLPPRRLSTWMVVQAGLLIKAREHIRP